MIKPEARVDQHQQNGLLKHEDLQDVDVAGGGRKYGMFADKNQQEYQSQRNGVDVDELDDLVLKGDVGGGDWEVGGDFDPFQNVDYSGENVGYGGDQQNQQNGYGDDHQSRSYGEQPSQSYGDQQSQSYVEQPSNQSDFFGDQQSNQNDFFGEQQSNQNDFFGEQQSNQSDFHGEHQSNQSDYSYNQQHKPDLYSPSSVAPPPSNKMPPTNQGASNSIQASPNLRPNTMPPTNQGASNSIQSSPAQQRNIMPPPVNQMPPHMHQSVPNSNRASPNPQRATIPPVPMNQRTMNYNRTGVIHASPVSQGDPIPPPPLNHQRMTSYDRGGSESIAPSPYPQREASLPPTAQNNKSYSFAGSAGSAGYANREMSNNGNNAPPSPQQQPRPSPHYLSSRQFSNGPIRNESTESLRAMNRMEMNRRNPSTTSSAGSVSSKPEVVHAKQNERNEIDTPFQGRGRGHAFVSWGVGCLLVSGVKRQNRFMMGADGVQALVEKEYPSLIENHPVSLLLKEDVAKGPMIREKKRDVVAIVEERIESLGDSYMQTSWALGNEGEVVKNVEFRSEVLIWKLLKILMESEGVLLNG
jgi:hypothetical protein